MKTYLVGGAVRDKLMGRASSDRDYVIVGATPDDVQALIDKGARQVGQDFPVFLIDDCEHALARTERKIGTGYKGFKVDTQNVTLTDDLMRRDLTINAMAMDESTGLIIDPAGGQTDIKLKVLRHVGPAFWEDPLRLLRLARFRARFSDFSIAPQTVQFCKEMVASGELAHIKGERYISELTKIVDEASPIYAFVYLLEFGIFDKGAPLCFLNEVFDLSLGSLRELNKLLSLTANLLSAEDKLTCVLMAFGKPQSFASVLSKQDVAYMTAYRELAAAHKIGLSEDRTLELIMGLGGGSAHSMHKFERFCALYELVSQVMAVDDHQAMFLRSCAWHVRNIRASNSQFDNLQGVELGNAIRAARLAAITKLRAAVATQREVIDAFAGDKSIDLFHKAFRAQVSWFYSKPTLEESNDVLADIVERALLATGHELLLSGKRVCALSDNKHYSTLLLNIAKSIPKVIAPQTAYNIAELVGQELKTLLGKYYMLRIDGGFVSFNGRYLEIIKDE